MRNVRPWLAAIGVGLCWGAAPGQPIGALFALLGARLLPQALTDDPREDAARGYLVGVLWLGSSYAWLPFAWGRFAGEGGASAMLAVVATHALLPAAALAAASAARRPWAAACAFAVADVIAGEVFAMPASPWMLLAGAPALCAPAALFGLPALSAALVLWGALPWRAAAAALGAWLLAGACVETVADRPAASVRIGIVEPDTGAFDARRGSTADARAERLASLARSARATLVIAPEGAWPLDPGDGPGARRTRLVEAFTGAPPTVLGASVGDPARNALLVVDGDVRGEFDKRALVPFAERAIRGWGLPRYVPGHGPRALTAADVKLSPLICYEDTVASARRAVDGELVVLATNDAWLGERGAEGHLAMARLVAMETGRWVVRAAMSGPSAVIDPLGRLRWRSAWVDGDVEDTGGRLAIVDVGLTMPPWNGARVAPLTGLVAAFALWLGRRRE